MYRRYVRAIWFTVDSKTLEYGPGALHDGFPSSLSFGVGAQSNSNFLTSTVYGFEFIDFEGTPLHTTTTPKQAPDRLIKPPLAEPQALKLGLAQRRWAGIFHQSCDRRLAAERETAIRPHRPIFRAGSEQWSRPRSQSTQLVFLSILHVRNCNFLRRSSSSAAAASCCSSWSVCFFSWPPGMTQLGHAGRGLFESLGHAAQNEP